MKKIFNIILLFLFAMFLTACSSDKAQANKSSSVNKEPAAEEVAKGEEFFKSEAQKIVEGYKEAESYYIMVGATGGFKIENTNEDIIAEFYIFDKESAVYKNAEKNQELCLGEDSCFAADVRNGYALVADESSYKQQLKDIFVQLD